VTDVISRVVVVSRDALHDSSTIVNSTARCTILRRYQRARSFVPFTAYPGRRDEIDLLQC